MFLLADYMQDILRLFPFYKALYAQYPFYVPEGLKSVLQICLVVLVPIMVFRWSLTTSFVELGFRQPMWRGLLFGVLATLPLWVGFGLTAKLTLSSPWAETLYLAVLSPLAEEVVFRGFAFGFLRRQARWGFWPAALLTAMIFGWGHVEKGQDLMTAAGLFLLTGVGSFFFAWFYERWGYRLWVPLSLHVLMNLSWQVFEVGESAVAGWFPMALQVSTVVFAIVLTVFRNRLRFLSYDVTPSADSR